MTCARDRHLFSQGPKRILSLDGGGVRGMLTLGFLERLEEILRQRSVAGADFRLADYFDLIGGTSTGAIIASGLALGLSVGDLIAIYRELSAQIFRKNRWRIPGVTAKFPHAPLVAALDNHFGDVTLGSNKISTGLAIVTKRLDTGSTWILHNNPRGKYFSPPQTGVASVGNRDYLLRLVVRASTAAPTFFEPEFITIAEGVSGAFVDGAVTPFNNPSLALFMMAGIQGYGLNWPLGADKLFLVSIGTGSLPLSLDSEALRTAPPLMVAVRGLQSLIEDGSAVAQTLLQWLSVCPTPWPIDGEVGSASGEMPRDRTLLTYARYNAVLRSDWLAEYPNLSFSAAQCQALAAIDNAGNLEDLLRIGRAVADRQILAEHFPAGFDIRSE